MITIIPEDKVVIVNGVSRRFDFTVSEDIHAVQIKGNKGVIETKDGNQRSCDLPEFQEIVDQHAAILAQEEADKIAKEKAHQEYLASPEGQLETVRKARTSEYPPIGDQLDAIMKWLATENEFAVPDELKSVAMKCMSVKAKYPIPGIRDVEG